MVTAPTAEQVDAVTDLLPADAGTYTLPMTVGDWIADRWTGGIISTVRNYWYQRVSDTASYIDLPDPTGTLSVTQQFHQAMEMLAYWDAYLLKYGDTTVPPVVPGRIPVTFGKIRNRYARDRACW